MNVWKDVLEKKVKASKLTLAITVPQDNKKDYEYQIFEVMIAEALNLCDHNASWQVTRGRNDKGVDLIGTEKRSYAVPFINDALQKKILGQVKRRSKGYSYDLFCGDLQKVQKYCINTEFYNNNALLYFIFILSTDTPNDIYNLRSRIKREIETKRDAVFISNRIGQIQICDASELMRIWKLNFPHFKRILSDALMEDELQLLSEFIDEIDNSWFSVSIGQESDHFVGKSFELVVSINTNMENIDVDMVVKWRQAKNNQFQLLSPLQAINPHKIGFPLRVHRNAVFKLVFRGLSAGEHDCGVLEFSSTEKKLIVERPIGKINLNSGFYPDYFYKPNHHILQNLETEVANKEIELIAYAITGCGGIGKSTLISEVMIHATSRGYECINIAQSKDLLNGRLLLQSLFKELVNLNEFEICDEQNVIYEIREHLQNRYKEDWNADLSVFFSNSNNEINICLIAECLANILINTTKKQPLFIWLSDMHWSSGEALAILRQVLLIFENNKAALYNKIFFIFEGRKGEALAINSTMSVPYDWYQFLENDYIIKLNLSTWSGEESRELLEKLIVPRENEMAIYAQLYNVLLQHSNGVPMHLLEHIRFLLNTGKLFLDKNQRLVILNNDFSSCISEEIAQTIRSRIIYFTEKYPIFIDIITIFAIFNNNMPHKLFLLFWKLLSDTYLNLRAIIMECDFIKIDKGGFSFLHEYYLTTFKENILLNSDAVSLCLDYFNGAFTEQEELCIIKLKQTKPNVQDTEIVTDIQKLLTQTKDLMIQYELYSMLLKFNNVSVLKIPKYKIHFELCEIMIKIGSWEKAAQHLTHLFDNVEDMSMECKYYRTLAYQELANIQCDRMEFDISIQTSLDGIELAKLCLKNKNINEALRNIFFTSYEKLLARAAVCYWFAGDHEKCEHYQKQSLASARSRNDAYAEAHVLYEIGTFKLHEDLDYGINLIQGILDNIDNIPVLAKHERSLIEVQQLIGKLLKAVKYSDRELIQDIILETRRLHDIYKAGNKHIYEEFLCYTIRAICLMVEGEHTQALFWFFESLKCASIGNMPNLEWKANFNLSQCYYIDGDELTSRMYAQQALNILKKAYTQNIKNRSYFCSMIKPVIKKLEIILDAAIIDFKDTKLATPKLLSVQIAENEFVIMN